MNKIKLLAVGLLLAFSSVWGQQGTLDNTFNSPNGFNYYSSGTREFHNGGLVVLNDGSIVMTANRKNAGLTDRLGLVKYLPDGTLDPTFTIEAYQLFGASYIVYTLAKQGNKFISAGKSSREGDNFIVVRFLSDGTLDPTFNGDGVLEVDIAGGLAEYVRSIIIDGNDIFVFGATNAGGVDYDIFSAKIDDNGNLDNSYGTNGISIISRIGDQYLNAAKKLSTGKFIIGGYDTNGSSLYARINSDGTLDNTYGMVLGFSFIDEDNLANDFVEDLEVISGDEVIAAGRLDLGGGAEGYFLRKLSSNGFATNNFGDPINSGRVIFQQPGIKNNLFDIQVMADQKIVGVGNYSNPGGTYANNRVLAVKYNIDGSLDNSFGTNGHSIIDLNGSYQIVRSMALQNDGKMLVSGFGVNSQEDWFIARINNDPIVPVLSLPTDNFIGESVLPNFDWLDFPGNVTYTIEVATDDQFNNIVSNINSGNTSNYQSLNTDTGFPLSNNTEYFWRVTSEDAGNNTYTSETFSFTTELAVPPIASPINNAINQDLNLTFTWTQVSGADGYILEVNSQNDFLGTEYFNSNVGNVASFILDNPIIPLEDNTTYYWQLTPVNSVSGNVGLPAGPFSFTTIQQTLTTPSDGAYSISINPTLTWPAVTGANEYFLEIDTDSNFGTASSYTETTNSKALTGLANNTTYHWRVTARNTRSAASSFTTHLATPNLTAPTDNAVNQPLNPTFTWDAVPGADNYEIEVNTASDFSGTDIYTNTNLGNVTTFTLDDPTNTIQDNQTFYWRLRAKNIASNTSLFSDTLSFSTIKQTLVVTTDEQTLVAINPTLEWTSLGGADNYRLEVNTAANFSGTVIFDNTVAGTTQQIGPLVYNTRYYWRVTASNLRSDVWSFVTILDTPVLDAPADNAILNTFTPTFTWTMNPNISNVEHELLLNTTDGTASPADVNNTTVVNPGSLSIQPAAPLNPATKYFWSINSRVNDGTALNDGEEKQSTERAFYTPLEITWPILGLTGVAIEPTFEWTETNFEDYYELRISTQGGSQIAFDANVIFTDLNIPQDTDSIRYTWATEDDANPGTYPFPLNNSTKYYWQLKAHDNVSGVTLSSPIWHFTTFPHKTVFAWNPANGFESTTTNVTFTWSLNQGTGGLKFRLQVKASNTVPTDTDWLTAEYDTTETSLSRTLQLAGGTKYYWRVLVLNDDEEVVTHSSVFYFTTKGGAVTPYPSWPIGNPTVYTNAPTLYWYLMGASTDLTFDIEVDQDQSGIADYSATNINGLFHTVGVNLLPGTQYSWRVRSVYKRGTPDEEIASWSSWNSFTTNGTGTLVVPTPSYPTGGLLVYNTTIQPYWYLGASGAGLVYDVQLSTTSDFSAGVTNYTDVASYANATFNLSPGETYYWRVRSDNGTTTSAWSSTAVFTVFGGSTYSYVYANWPIGGVTVYSNTPTLSWYLDGSRANFSKYHVKWKAGSNSSDWSSDFDGQTDILDPNTTTYTFGTGLTYGETYYWGVAAVFNGTDYTDWAEGSFKVVGGASAGEPILSYPFDGTLIFGTDVTLSWYLNGSSAGIQGYEVVYSNSDVFAPAATNTVGPNGQTSSSVSISGLTVGATYYWKVRSWYGGSTYSNYSSTYSFVINSSTNSPLQPKIGGPTNNIIVNSANPTLSWVITSQPVNGLTYELEIADNAEMNDAVLVNEISTSFYESAESLEKDKNYFWRVRSKTEDGTYSYYSGIGKFKVGDNVTSVEELLIPDKFTVEQNYPNPFNPTTIIKFGLPEQTAVSVKIYNMLGQEVKTLLNDVRNAGTYNLQWNGDDNFGNKVASGAYIYRIVAGKDVATKKMILIK